MLGVNPGATGEDGRRRSVHEGAQMMGVQHVDPLPAKHRTESPDEPWVQAWSAVERQGSDALLPRARLESDRLRGRR